MKKQAAIKILIIDDHQMMIDGIKSLLKNESGIEIVGEMLNGKEALPFLKNNAVEIVIMDITMPEISGVELTKMIKKEYPLIKVIILTMHDEISYIKDIIDAQAWGYVLKNLGEKELIAAIYSVASGKKHYSDHVLSAIVSGINSKTKVTDPSILTSREMEILKLVVKGYSSPKIAESLFISELTVETHRKNISRKTNTKGVADLINYAYKNKLVTS